MKASYRIISLIAAAAMAFLPFSPVSAEENRFPSGIAFEEIGSKVEELAADVDYASFQTSVFCGDDTLYTGRFGYSDMDNKVTTDENSVYEWGSVSKIFVWVSIMQLYEQGKIDLDRDIREYLPADFFKRLKYDDPITVTDLMNHKGGWQESSYSIQAKSEKDIPDLEEALRYAEPEQVFRPGEISAYSNYGAALAGYLVELISGEKFYDYVHTHIFEPLGMEHSSYAPDHSDNPWVKQQLQQMMTYNIIVSDEQTLEIPLGESSFYLNIYPAGAAAGTADDLAKLGKALVSDNCPLFEKKETADLLFSGSDFFGETDIPKYCHGLFTTCYGVTAVGHGGNTTGCTANLIFHRESKVGCAVVTNQFNELYFTRKIPEILFGSPNDNPIFAGAENSENIDLTGRYLISREHHKGNLRILSLLKKMDIKKNSSGEYVLGESLNIKQLGNGLIAIDNDGEYLLAEISKGSKGENIISITTQDFISSDTAKAEMWLVIACIAVAAAGYILLMTAWIKKIVTRRKSFSGAPYIFAGQIAMITSCLGVLLTIAAYGKSSGITHVQSFLSGSCQILCMAVYAVSLGTSVKALFVKSADNANPALYIFTAVSDIIAAAAIIVLNAFCF